MMKCCYARFDISEVYGLSQAQGPQLRQTGTPVAESRPQPQRQHVGQWSPSGQVVRTPRSPQQSRPIVDFAQQQRKRLAEINEIGWPAQQQMHQPSGSDMFGNTTGRGAIGGLFGGAFSDQLRDYMGGQAFTELVNSPSIGTNMGNRTQSWSPLTSAAYNGYTTPAGNGLLGEHLILMI